MKKPPDPKIEETKDDLLPEYNLDFSKAKSNRFTPGEKAKERVADLIHCEKTTGLTAEETAELDHYMQLEHLMRLAKARARRYLNNE